MRDYIVFYMYTPLAGPDEKRIVAVRAYDERHAEDRFYAYHKPNIGFNGITKIMEVGK